MPQVYWYLWPGKRSRRRDTVDHKVFIYIEITDLQRMNLAADNLESEPGIKLPCGGLLRTDGQTDLLQSGDLGGTAEQVGQES